MMSNTNALLLGGGVCGFFLLLAAAVYIFSRRHTLVRDRSKGGCAAADDLDLPAVSVKGPERALETNLAPKPTTAQPAQQLPVDPIKSQALAATVATAIEERATALQEAQIQTSPLPEAAADVVPEPVTEERGEMQFNMRRELERL